MRQKPLLQGVWFEHSSYDALDIPLNSIVYCDSPYKGTTQYKDKFDHEPYWEWCREQVKKGHKVFISEYNAPEDFVLRVVSRVKLQRCKKMAGTRKQQKTICTRNADRLFRITQLTTASPLLIFVIRRSNNERI